MGNSAFIFVDEILPNKEGFLIFGVLLVKQKFLKDFIKNLNAINKACSQEVKFSKIRNIPSASVPLESKKIQLPNKKIEQVALDWIYEFFGLLKSKRAKFICYMVDIKHPEYKGRWFGKRGWLQYNKHLNTAISKLKYVIKSLKIQKVTIALDERTLTKEDNLREYLTKTLPEKLNLGKNSVRFRFIKSKGAPYSCLIQTTDLVMGSLSYPYRLRRNPKLINAAKVMLARKFKKRRVGVSQSTFPKSKVKDAKQKTLV